MISLIIIEKEWKFSNFMMQGRKMKIELESNLKSKFFRELGQRSLEQYISNNENFLRMKLIIHRHSIGSH